METDLSVTISICKKRIHRIDQNKTNYAIIDWIVIFPVGSVIQPFSNLAKGSAYQRQNEIRLVELGIKIPDSNFSDS